MRGGVELDMNRTKTVTLDSYWYRNASIEASAPLQLQLLT